METTSSPTHMLNREIQIASLESPGLDMGSDREVKR